MGTKTRETLIKVVYSVLAILLIAIQSTAQIEDFPHMVFGIAFFVLILFHLFLNKPWICHSVRGRWDFHRVITTFVIVALAVLVLAQVVNCILLSSFFWSMLPQEFAFFSASLHMAIGSWIFVLASIHLGINIQMVVGNRLRIVRTTGSNKHVRAHNVVAIALIALVSVASVYGIIEIVTSDIIPYMLMMNVDSSSEAAPIFMRIVRYVCIGTALCAITHCASILANRLQKPNVAVAHYSSE